MQRKTDDESMISTPSVTRASFLDLTPGEILSRSQAEVLKKDRFVHILGSNIVESWGLDWITLEDPVISFDDSRKIFTMSILRKYLRNVAFERYDSDFNDLYTSFLALRDRISIVHKKRLELKTKQYFEFHHPHSTVQYNIKTGGVQLGIKVNVTLHTTEVKKYFVKTHSNGRISSKSSAASLVNPKELLVYKVLEHLGIGCESHFFQRSAEDVYIATLDAGHGGSFNVFKKAAGNLDFGGDEVYGHSLWGMLHSVGTDPTRNDWKFIEDAAQHDMISKNFFVQIAALDLVSRILRLHDLLNNPDNFGFFSKDGELPTLKVIDFRVAEDTHYTVGPDQYGGFLIGNGFYNYAQSHRTLRYCLHDRPQNERVSTALDVLTKGSLSRFSECVECAFQDVCKYITETKEFTLSMQKMLNQLRPFYEALLKNIVFFSDMLQKSQRDFHEL